MKLTTISALIWLGLALPGIPAFAQAEQRGEGIRQQEHGARDKKMGVGKREARDRDIDMLYEMVLQARAELQALRRKTGSRGERGERRREGRGEHDGRRGGDRGEHGLGGREGRGEHGEGRREGRGEHGEGGREGRGESGKGEEGGTRLGKYEKWDRKRNGARLILAYSAATQSFKGTVQNTTSKTLSQVRVEVHLSNGVELGPTKRTDLRPGEKIPVELSAANQSFRWWTTHPEHGSEEGHGPERGGEAGKGEHGRGIEGDGSRPKDPALRPLYNQLQLLRREIKMLASELRGSRR